MAQVIPFKAVRPSREKVALVASRPYEEYSLEELNFHLANNPYSFLHIINPGYKFQKNISGEERFQLVKNRYLEFKEEEIFIQDPKACYYIYQSVSVDQSFCGIIAAASVEDYEQNVIKRHEDTISQREKLFKEYLKVAGFNTEPVLLTYPDNPAIEDIIVRKMKERPEYEFSSFNKDTHYIWVVSEPELTAIIQQEFEKMPSLYIADGHHRSASSWLLARDMAENNPNHTGQESYNFFMSYLIAESHLKLYEFNRLVRDLNGLSKRDFLLQLDSWFRIENRGQSLFRPRQKHEFSMYLDGEFYSLVLRKSAYSFTDPLSKIDPYILYCTVLKPILGIEDPKDDVRLRYLPGKNEAYEVKKAVDDGKFAVGFGMLPLTFSDIKEVSDFEMIMPPKSTYIEPKLRSGLTIYEF